MTQISSSSANANTTHKDVSALAPAIISTIVAMAVYACTLAGTYIYDDVQVIQLDPRISQPSLWRYFWTRDYMIGAPDKLFRPLTSMSFAIQWWLHGDRAWAFHLVNILLNAGVTALVAVLAARIAGLRVAWIAGLLFAVHPVHVEAVAGLVGRSELLCTLATLGGLCIFLGGRLTLARVLAISECFLTALLSKEQGMLFPLLLLAAVPLWRALGLAPGHRSTARWLIVLITWIFSAYIVWRESTVRLWWDRSFLAWESNPMVRSVGFDRVLMPVDLLGRYVALLVAPVRLSIDYGATVIGWKVSSADPYLYLGIAAVLLWTVLIARALSRRSWPTVFCLLGLAISYGMIGNIIAMIGTNMAERLIYLPSVFFIIWVAMMLRRIQRKVLLVIMTALLLAGSARSFIYARRWNDRFQFYQWSSENQPKSIRIYALLWNEYKDRGDWAGALRVGMNARMRVPESWESYQMCAEALDEMGDFSAALKMVDEGMSHAPCLELKLMHAEIESTLREQQGEPTTRGSGD
jgi:hypothetical protein